MGWEMSAAGVGGAELLSLVLEFEVEKGGTPPGTVGRAIHALFFEILRELNPDLAEKIHSMRPYKPFTLSPLCLLYTSPSPRDLSTSRMPSSA